MRENGTDRDIALLILDGLNSCAALVASVNDNLYVPHITTQPTDQTGAIGGEVTFTVVANNVAAYQWQYKTSTAEWRDSSTAGSDSASYTLVVNASRLTYQYRCKITGKDGSTIYSDAVRMIEAEAET